MDTENSKKILYYLIIIIVIMSILCYFVNLENFETGTNNSTPRRKPLSRAEKAKIAKIAKEKEKKAKAGKTTNPPVGSVSLDNAKKNADLANKELLLGLGDAAQKGLIIQQPVDTNNTNISNALNNTTDSSFTTYNIKPTDSFPQSQFSTTPRPMKAPLYRIQLSDDRKTHLFMKSDGSGKENKIIPTSDLKCWNNEIIANINKKDDHYEFDCYKNPNKPTTESPWICHPGDNWNEEANNVPYITLYKKNESGDVQCGSNTNDYKCQGFNTMTECKKAVDDDKNNILKINPTYKCANQYNYGTNQWHWCSRLYHDLTKSGY